MRTSPRRRLRAVAVMGCIAAAVVGIMDADDSRADEPETQPTPPASQAVAAERVPEYPHPLAIPSSVLRKQEQHAIILPSSPDEEDLPPELRDEGLIAEVDPGEPILPDGYVVARRAGRFSRDEPWWMVTLEPAEKLPTPQPLRVLPNRELMLLEQILTEGRANDAYLVTGRITEFLGRNHILLEEVVAARKPSDPAPVTAGQPDATPDDTTSGQPPTPEEIIEQLMQDAPRRVLDTSVSTAPVDLPAPSDDESGPVFREGTIVREFPARLVRVAPWWMLIREARGGQPASKPYRVLPNRLLEVIVSASAGGTHSMVFLVSGELTEYRGVNYLLIRKVLIRRDLGNLR
ncbi:MAG: hypothetical protein JXA69_02230 [Phycisphaerae bacterium]|nr:hypothetical protein [Phycisphaerae bacterium]